MLEAIGMIATVGSIAGVILNNRHNRWCFAIWFVTNFMSAGIHVYSHIWSLALRDAIFFVLAVEGWILWSKKGA